MKAVIAMTAAAGLLAASGALATETVKADPAKAQQIVNTVCAGCHGVDGNSVVPVNPKLAGQHADYIAKQLQDFKTMARNSPVMLGMAAALSPEDMKNLGAYFATQKPNPGQPAADAALAAKGEKLYRGGDAKRGLPACAGCHGPAGAGIPAQFPRLAGQHGDYIAGQLKAFRDEQRANDPSKMMRSVALKMTDKDIAALSAYIAAQK